MADDALSTEARWHATVSYRTDADLLEDETLLREIADLHDWMERGPHWDTIVDVHIKRINHIDNTSLTIEQAKRL
jgi:hypothetical protein